MSKLIDKRWFNVVIATIFILNIFFVTYYFSVLKGQKTKNPQSLEEKLIRSQIEQVRSDELYNTPCPEITLTALNNRIIDLKELKGNVIIIKFSRFYKRDLPHLIYLEHLAGKLKNEGISLIFVNSLGKHYSKEINKICYFASPIVEDDGTISRQFNAGPEEIVIIDRNFKIRFIYNLFYKTLVFNEINKWIFGAEIPVENIAYEELSSIVKRLTYYDVLEKKEKQIILPELKRKTVLTLFTSVCTGCEENYKIRLIKELSSDINPKNTQLIFLFGIGNSAKAMRQYASLNGLNELPITIGVIRDLNEAQKNDYYKLFRLDTDPRTFILNIEGGVIFAENPKNSRLIDINFLKKAK